MSIRVGPLLRREVEERANELEMSVSEFVRYSLQVYFDFLEGLDGAEDDGIDHD